MISRVAESCFWLHRYLERATNLARLLRVHRSFLLDLPLDEPGHWQPLIIVSGERERFAKLHPGADNDPEVVQEYLTWSAENPASMCSSIHWARENARTIQDVVSPEMWEVLNGFQNWLRRGPGRRLWREDRDAFYLRIQRMVDEFYGAEFGTMLHEDALEFMRLGAMLERAAQTARILDVKYHLLGRTRGHNESALELAEWTALLHSCSAVVAFQRTTRRNASGPAVVDFLLREPSFPRSVYHCLDRAADSLRRIAHPEAGSCAPALVTELLGSLRERDADAILEEGIHEVLTQVIDRLSELCEAIHADYFDPPLTPLHAETP